MELTVAERIALAVAIKESIDGLTKLLEHSNGKVDAWAKGQIEALNSAKEKLDIH